MESLRENVKASVLEYLTLHGEDVKVKLRDMVTPMIDSGINAAITEFIQQEINVVVDENLHKSMEEKLQAALGNIKNSGQALNTALTDIIQNDGEELTTSITPVKGGKEAVLAETVTKLDGLDSMAHINKKTTALESFPQAEKAPSAFKTTVGLFADVSKADKTDEVVKGDVNSRKDKSGTKIIKNPFAPEDKVLSNSKWSSADDEKYAILTTSKNPFASDDDGLTSDNSLGSDNGLSSDKGLSSDDSLSSSNKSSVDNAEKSTLQVVKNPFDPAYQAKTATQEVMGNPFAPKGKGLTSSKWSRADDEQYAILKTLKNPFAPDDNSFSGFKESSGEKTNKATLKVIKSPPVPAHKAETATLELVKMPFAPDDKDLGSLSWSSIDAAAPDGSQQQAVRTSKVKRRNGARNGQRQGRHSKTPYQPKERTS